MSYAPGPWKIDPLKMGTPWTVYDFLGDPIALVNERIEDPRAVKRPPMRDANARLIAAAPQLLEALKMWHKYGSTDWKDDVAMMLFYADCEAKTAAAIRAAEGGE